MVRTPCCATTSEIGSRQRSAWWVEGVAALPGEDALAILARTLLARDQRALALQVALEAAETLEGLGGIDDGEAIIRLALAEALDATGRREEARAALALAVARERAGRMPEDHRALFLQAVPENRRTLDLATRWATQS